MSATMVGSTKSPLSSSALDAPALVRALVPMLAHLVVAQVDALAGRLANALLAVSEQSSEPRLANLSFNAGQLLKNNAYAFYYLATAEVEAGYRKAVDEWLSRDAAVAKPTAEATLSLVSFEEMDQKLALSRASRTLELACAEQYAALNMRLGALAQEEALATAQNPFRPEVLLRSLYASWCEFNPDQDSHDLLLPLLRADIFFDLAPMIQALNEALVAKGVLPDLHESYRIRKNRSALRAPGEPPLDRHEQLRRLLEGEEVGGSEGAGMPGMGEMPAGGAAGGGGGSHPHPHFAAPGASGPLFHYMADLQKSLTLQQWVGNAQGIPRLSQLRERMPEMAQAAQAPVERQTLDLLSQIFDEVFANPNIPLQIKELIAILQIPVLKAALLDKEFFFQDQHPARRLIELLSQYSLSCDFRQGQDDPLFRAMQHNVQRIQKEFDQQLAIFDEVLHDLEARVRKDEATQEEALAAPIKQALRKEKIRQANIAATQEVSLRVGSGEVVAFVETFLENRWVKVLTLAYTLQEEKPHAVQDAIKTMDDLIWSVKPKITLQQRQELLNRLPAILARLNKWLSLVKWNDEDRARFFAELAECHASIVRAPLDLSPERQLEIAVEVAQQAAERRLAQRAMEETHKEFVTAAPVQSDPVQQRIETLERGTWFAIRLDEQREPERWRLAWVSPMRSLFIFTTTHKEKTVSMPVEALDKAYREGRIETLELDRVMGRALENVLDAQDDEGDAGTPAPVAEDEARTAPLSSAPAS